MNIREAQKNLDAEIQKIRERQTQLYIAAQKRCQHKIIVEGACRSLDTLGFTQPPFYVCMECGLAEEQWHCGPWIHFVKKAERQIVRQDRDAARKLIVGPLIQQDELEGLGRFGVKRGLQWCIDNGRPDLPPRSPLPNYRLTKAQLEAAKANK